jgi:hypothetical protein
MAAAFIACFLVGFVYLPLKLPEAVDTTAQAGSAASQVMPSHLPVTARDFRVPRNSMDAAALDLRFSH